MKFRFVVEVEVNRTQGKFAGRDEIETQIQEALEGADPGTYEGENGGEYETADWSVSAEAEPKPVKVRHPVRVPVSDPRPMLTCHKCREQVAPDHDGPCPKCGAPREEIWV
jgi:rRNA maturation endonuclease Nob1